MTASSFAQMQRKIVIDSVVYDPDQPVLVGTTIYIFPRIHLTDSANNWVSGNGNVRYWVRSDSMNLNGHPPVLIDNLPIFESIPAGGRFDTLALPLDSLDLRVSSTGPVNVIIIWPSLVKPGIDLADSGFVLINQYVYTDIGIDEENIPPSTIYPNPSGSFELVYIRKQYTQLIDHITIVDNLGQPVFIKQFTPEDESSGYLLPTHELRSGMYYLQIYYKDKKMETVRYIKSQ